MVRLSEQAKKRKAEYDAKYKKENERQYIIHINKKTNADIIAKLDSVPNKQKYIFDLIRKDIEDNKA